MEVVWEGREGGGGGGRDGLCVMEYTRTTSKTITGVANAGSSKEMEGSP